MLNKSPTTRDEGERRRQGATKSTPAAPPSLRVKDDQRKQIRSTCAGRNKDKPDRPLWRNTGTRVSSLRRHPLSQGVVFETAIYEVRHSRAVTQLILLSSVQQLLLAAGHRAQGRPLLGASPASCQVSPAALRRAVQCSRQRKQHAAEVAASATFTTTSGVAYREAKNREAGFAAMKRAHVIRSPRVRVSA